MVKDISDWDGNVTRKSKELSREPSKLPSLTLSQSERDIGVTPSEHHTLFQPRSTENVVQSDVDWSQHQEVLVWLPHQPQRRSFNSQELRMSTLPPLDLPRPRVTSPRPSSMPYNKPTTSWHQTSGENQSPPNTSLMKTVNSSLTLKKSLKEEMTEEMESQEDINQETELVYITNEIKFSTQ